MECNVELSTSVDGIVFSSIRSFISSNVARFPSCITHLSESQRVIVFLEGMFASNDDETEKSMVFFNPKRKGNIEQTGTRRIQAFFVDC